MDEKEEKTIKKEEPAIDSPGDGDKSETISELDRADQIAERQARENDRREAILKREENLAARKAIGGETEAGKPEKKKEETPKEYKDRVMRGEA